MLQEIPMWFLYVLTRTLWSLTNRDNIVVKTNGSWKEKKKRDGHSHQINRNPLSSRSFKAMSEVLTSLFLFEIGQYFIKNPAAQEDRENLSSFQLF